MPHPSHITCPPGRRLVSQVVVVVFSQTVLAHYRQTEQQRVLVEVLGQCIAHMDLERAAQLECESPNVPTVALVGEC